VQFSNIFDILKTYDVIPCVCPLIDHGSRPMKSHEFLRLLYKKNYTTLYKAMRDYTTLYNVMQDYTTIYKAIQRYTMLYKTYNTI
jgi:hypothetical protein